MRSLVIALLLSAGTTLAALGQCVTLATTTPAAAPAATPAAIGAKRPAAARQAADLTARQGPELITAAAAVTHDGPSTTQPAPARTRGTPGERPRRAGPAMLLAALALMSAIALRRFSARDQ